MITSSPLSLLKNGQAAPITSGPEVEETEMQPPPTDPTEQLQWLLHRAAITDLQNEYARCLDDKDFITWQSLFTDDAELHMPYESLRKADLPSAAHRVLD